MISFLNGLNFHAKKLINEHFCMLFAHFDPVKRNQISPSFDQFSKISNFNIHFLFAFTYYQLVALDGIAGLHYEAYGNLNFTAWWSDRHSFLHQLAVKELLLQSDIIMLLNHLTVTAIFGVMMGSSEWSRELIYWSKKAKGGNELQVGDMGER